MPFQKGHPLYSGGEKGWFQKGSIPWNKGKAKTVKNNCQYCDKEIVSPLWQIKKFCSCGCFGKFNRIEKVRLICKRCKKEFLVYPSEQDKVFCSIKCNVENIKIAMKGHIPWNKGLRKYNEKEKHPQWKGGVTWDKEYWNKRRRNKYANDNKYRLRRLAQNYQRISNGRISLKLFQLVYEDNIKQFGTLTCYLCLKPIEFRQDCIEHKIPLSRGGTNLYENLAISHRTCNSKKHNKTINEYRKLEVKNGSRLVRSKKRIS